MHPHVPQHEPQRPQFQFGLQRLLLSFITLAVVAGGLAGLLRLGSDRSQSPMLLLLIVASPIIVMMLFGAWYGVAQALASRRRGSKRF